MDTLTRFRISATVPTVYQRTSLTHFGMPIKENRDGSFTAHSDFDSLNAAKRYLMERFELYVENGVSEADRLFMQSDIEDGHSLSLDAATAFIEEINLAELPIWSLKNKVGELIEKNMTQQQAIEYMLDAEEEDKHDGEYVPEFYEVLMAE